MSWMPRRLILLLAGSALLLVPLLSAQLATGAGRAHACSCVWPLPPPLEALEEASAVFSGTVLSFETFSFVLIREVQGDEYRTHYWSVEFEVDAVWKGSVTTTTFVYTWFGPSCGYPWFEIGEEFLVYTHERSGFLRVGQCSRTRFIEDVEWDLRELGEGQPPDPGITGASPSEVVSPDAGTSIDFLRLLAWAMPLLAAIAAALALLRLAARPRPPG